MEEGGIGFLMQANYKIKLKKKNTTVLLGTFLGIFLGTLETAKKLEVVIII